MTTSGRARKPPGRRPTEADTTPNAVQSPDTAVAGGKPGKGPLAGGLSAAPDDRQQLEQEIERTREQLGETVEQLAAKADVKSRAQTRAAEVSRRVKTKASQARQQAAARAGNVCGQLAGKTAAARHQAVSAGAAGKDQLRSRVAAVGTPLREATPESLRLAAAKGASGARRYRAPLAVAAGVLVGGYLANRWWRKR
jgi:ABC-type transporter Mla subunit MlaD